MFPLKLSREREREKKPGAKKDKSLWIPDTRERVFQRTKEEEGKKKTVVIVTPISISLQPWHNGCQRFLYACVCVCVCNSKGVYIPSRKGDSLSHATTTTTTTEHRCELLFFFSFFFLFGIITTMM